MQDLAEVIIQRIKDAHQAKRIQEKVVTVLDGERESTDRKKKIEHTIGAIEARQRGRVKLDLSLISSMKSITLVSQQNFNEFYAVSSSIFRAHSPSFQHKFQNLEKQAINMKIHRLYRQFLHKYANTFRFAHISSILFKENGQIFPAIYLGWIGEWSRGLLAENLKKQSSDYESLRLRFELNRMVRIDEQKTVEGQAVLITLQSAYGYILSQLEEYYQRFQLLGLDFNYLKGINNQIGRKDQIFGRHAKNTINFLIAKNNSNTATIINKYLEQYQSFLFRKYKKSNKLIIHDSIMKQRIAASLFTKNEMKVNKEQDILLNRLKSPRKNKELSGQPHKKLEFPLIQSIPNNAKEISPKKPKKNTRASSKTQPQEQNIKKISILSSEFCQRSISNKESTSSSNISRIRIGFNVFNEFNLLENQFQSRRKSIVCKIKDKSNNFAFKEEVNRLIVASYLDYHAFASKRHARNSLKLFD